MSTSKTIRRRLIACLGAASLAAGICATATGVAQAAVPDKWGFAYVNNPTVPGVTDLMHQAGSWPAPFHVKSAPSAPGQVVVTFPRIAAKGGVVHVTAVNAKPVWCQVQKYGPSGLNEVVVVRCFHPGGGAVFSPFSIMFTTSTKGPFSIGAYGYVHFTPPHAIIASFNSVGATNTVTSGPTGVWKVRMPGLGTAVKAGDVQVTAVNPSVPAKCEIAAWASSVPLGQVFVVRCYNAGSAPLNTGWTLSYQRARAITGRQGKLFAYTVNTQPLLPGPYVPAPPSINFNSVSATNSITRAGTGLSLVKFPGVGVLPNTVLVTGFNVGPGFCNLLTLWATTAGAPIVLVRDVACYTAAGALKSQQSLITYTSKN
jgi:hypothetical protein